jgi:hypothetical protein
LAQDLLMIEEAERRRREKKIDEKIEVTKCNLYSDFQHKMQKKLENLHKQVKKLLFYLMCIILCYYIQQAKAEKSRIVPLMVLQGEKNRDTRLDSWMVKIGKDRKERCEKRKHFRLISLNKYFSF